MIPGRRAINRRALAVCFALLVSGTSSLAHADDVAIAEQLFLDGKKLMQDGQYEQACSKLQASHDLDRTKKSAVHEQVDEEVVYANTFSRRFSRKVRPYSQHVPTLAHFRP